MLLLNNIVQRIEEAFLMECFLLCKNYIGGVEMTLTLHNGDLNKLARDTSQDSIILRVGEQEMVSLKSNGDIYVKGKLVENDKEVVDGMRELLMLFR